MHCALGLVYYCVDHLTKREKASRKINRTYLMDVSTIQALPVIIAPISAVMVGTFLTIASFKIASDHFTDHQINTKIARGTRDPAC